MARVKGSKNQASNAENHYINLPTEERLDFLATLIVDRIEHDISNNQELLKKIRERHDNAQRRQPVS